MIAMVMTRVVLEFSNPKLPFSATAPASPLVFLSHLAGAVVPAYFMVIFFLPVSSLSSVHLA